MFRTVNLHGQALTGEALLKARVEAGAAQHEFGVAARGRVSRVLTENLPPIRLGRFPIDAPRFGLPPAFPSSLGPLNSDVDQGIGSINYSGDYAGRLEVRAGLHRVRYIKRVRQPSGIATRRAENSWVYNASVVFAVGRSLTVFANTVKGVEESGTSPQNATNLNEILPPVTATEYELGARWAVTPKLGLILAGFSTTKLTPGLRPDGIFTLVGNVRHRGGEVSLNGEVRPGTSVVIGAMKMKPRLSGQLIDAGVIGSRPIGVAGTVGVFSFDQRFGWIPGLSIDSRLNWNGRRAANARNTFETGEYALWSLGGRYAFSYDDRPITVRSLASNVLTNRPYIVGSSGLFQQFNGTTYRLTVRVGLLGE